MSFEKGNNQCKSDYKNYAHFFSKKDKNEEEKYIASRLEKEADIKLKLSSPILAKDIYKPKFNSKEFNSCMELIFCSNIGDSFDKTQQFIKEKQVDSKEDLEKLMPNIKNHAEYLVNLFLPDILLRVNITDELLTEYTIDELCKNICSRGRDSGYMWMEYKDNFDSMKNIGLNFVVKFLKKVLFSLNI